MTHDCCFTKGKEWFRYRAAAIIVEDGCALLVGNGKEDYLYSVGGGVHHGETAQQAVLREVFEETGVRYEIDRLAVIHENFWNGDGAYDKGLSCHEISLYFLMKPRGTKELHSESYTHFNDKESMVWVPIDELNSHRFYPTFLKDYLDTEHDAVEHRVTGIIRTVVLTGIFPPAHCQNPREPVRVRCGFAAVRQKSAPSKLRRTENEQDFEQVSVQKVQAGWRLPRSISRKLPKYCHFQQVRIIPVTLSLPMKELRDKNFLVILYAQKREGLYTLPILCIFFFIFLFGK